MLKVDPKLKFLIQWSLAVSIYLVIEWFYNQHLLQLLTYPDINEDQFNVTEVFGKILAAFGINFVIKELFKYKGIVGFLVGVVVAYIGLTMSFEYALNNAPEEYRYSSYYSSAYRSDVVKGEDKNKILQINSDSWYTKPMLLSLFFTTIDTNDWKTYEEETQKTSNKYVNKISADKESYWAKYQRAENGRQRLQKGWNQYQLAQYKYNRYKYGRHKDIAYKKFIEKVGLKPDLNEPMYYRAAGKEYMVFLETKFFDGVEKAGISPIYGKDIPNYMNKAAFFNYLDTKVNMTRTAVAPKVSEIKRNRLSKNALATIIIPPISLTLSFLSIVLNTYFILVLWIGYFFEKYKIKKRYFYGLSVFLFIIMTASFYLAPKSVSSFEYWALLEARASDESPVLSFFWDFMLKGETILCPTVSLNNQVVSFTKYFYSK